MASLRWEAGLLETGGSSSRMPSSLSRAAGVPRERRPTLRLRGVASRDGGADGRLDRRPVEHHLLIAETEHSITAHAQASVACIVALLDMELPAVELDDESIAEYHVDAVGADLHLLPDTDAERPRAEHEDGLGDASRAPARARERERGGGRKARAHAAQLRGPKETRRECGLDSYESLLDAAASSDLAEGFRKCDGHPPARRSGVGPVHDRARMRLAPMVVARITQLARVRGHGDVHLSRVLEEPQTGFGSDSQTCRSTADANAVRDRRGRVGKHVPPLAHATDLTRTRRATERFPPEPCGVELMRGCATSQLMDAALEVGHTLTMRASPPSSCPFCAARGFPQATPRVQELTPHPRVRRIRVRRIRRPAASHLKDPTVPNQGSRTHSSLTRLVSSHQPRDLLEMGGVSP